MIDYLFKNMDCAPSVRIRDFERLADGHVAYVIEFQATSNTRSGNQSTCLVTRRFSDFLVLRKALRYAYPMCVIPPLPGKTDLLTTFRQRLSMDVVPSSSYIGSFPKPSGPLPLGASGDNDLPSYRCHALQTFLRHLLLHHHLSRDPLFHGFLQPEGDWKVHLTRPPYNGEPFALPYPLASTPDTAAECIPNASVDVGTSPSTVTNDHTSRSTTCFTVNTNLLKNRGTALIAAFQHLDAEARRLLDSCTHVHRLHKNYAEALWQWLPYENGSSSFAHCLQAVGQELDSYSTIMDPAMEEFDNLTERFHVWENYGHSLTEVHLAYQKVQHEADNVRKRNTLTRTSSKEKNEERGTSAPTGNDQSLLTSSGHQILSESLHFERLFERDLISILHAFSYAQFRQAERCLRIWERIQSQLQHTADELEATGTHSGHP